MHPLTCHAARGPAAWRPARSNPRTTALGAILLLLLFFSPASAAEIAPDYLFSMDIEDLMSTEVTSVSRYDQLLVDSAAAVTVIGREQIARSGLRDLPEILRLAPGMQVARQGAGFWVASSRAFPTLGNNKLLVLLDGRSVYNEDVGEVYWSTQSAILEDLEQIEVIRGPGGTHWGYNAVNGVVNIVSRKVRDTQGLLIDAGMADDGSRHAQVRYGAQAGGDVFYRLYYDGLQQEDFRTMHGRDANDGYRRRKGGLRVDLEPDAASLYTFEGIVLRDHGGDAWAPVQTESRFDETHLRLRAERQITRSLGLMAQVYYSHTDHVFSAVGDDKAFAIAQRIADAEVQADWALGRHRILTGGGARFSEFSTEDGYYIDFVDRKDRWRRYNLMLTDEIALIHDRLFATMGTKAEYNDQTGWGWQPSARLLFKPSAVQSVWASVSRALRMPYFEDGAERYMAAVYTDLGWVVDHFKGEPVKDEEILAYEIGYRHQITPNFSIDAAGFFNQLDQIRFWEYTAVSLPASPGDPIVFDVENNFETDEQSYGAELSVLWQVARQWALRCGYAYIRSDYDVPDPEYWYAPPDRAERHLVQLHSELDLTTDIRFDTHLYWNSAAELGWIEIPETWRLDLRLAINLGRNARFVLTGQNLLDPDHLEIRDGSQYWDYEAMVPRRVIAGIVLSF